MTTVPVADRRAARKAATRDAIADALLHLLSEGSLRPTAREIAGRAGFSLRSVYVHFDDLEDLFCVAAKRHFERVAPMLTPIAVSGSVRDRATALVQHRVELYLKVGPVGLATRLQAPFSPTLERIVRDAHTQSRREIERVFALELDAMDGPRRKRTVAAVDVLTSAHAWELLRESHGLTRSEATQTVVDSVLLELGRIA